MPHVVLLGDSIFDNAAYVAGGPDVATQLRSLLPRDWRVTLLAVDGAVLSGVPSQLARLPSDATHLVLSAGGNDALGNVGILDRPARSVSDALDLLAEMGSAFGRRYRETLGSLRSTALPVVACTIYEGALPDPVFQRRAVTALHLFNEAILRAAFGSGIPVIDLRLVCADPGDYANPIEPSVQGGAKIARAIAGALGVGEARRSEVIT